MISLSDLRGKSDIGRHDPLATSEPNALQKFDSDTRSTGKDNDIDPSGLFILCRNCILLL